MSIYCLPVYAVLCCMGAWLNAQALPDNFPASDLPTEAYQEAKTRWIADNPEAYRALGGNPEEVLSKSIATPAAQVEPVQPPKDWTPVFRVSEHWVLTKAEAMALPGKSLEASVLAQTTAALQLEFPLNATHLYRGQGQVDFQVLNKYRFLAKETRKNPNLEWYREDKACPTCSKTLYLRIERETQNEVVYDLADEDESAVCTYRLYFIRKS